MPIILEGLNDNKIIEFTPTGVSMFPNIIGNIDKVYLSKIDKLKKYDMVLYKKENGPYILHRIIKVKKDYYIIEGDNQLRFKDKVCKKDIIAKVIKYEHKGKMIDCNIKKFYFNSFFKVLLKFPRKVFYKIFKTKQRYDKQ